MLVFGFLLLVVLAYFYFKKPVTTIPSSEGFAPNGNTSEQSINTLPRNEYIVDDDMEDDISSKFITKNTNMDPRKYKEINYANGIRGESMNDGEAWKNYFDDNNNLIEDSQVENDGFEGIDETIGTTSITGSSCNAAFKETGRAKCGSNQDCSVEELFNPENYMPQEQNDEWWDTMDQPIAIKDRHLINVNKPIGINTIGSSLRNASYDIRGTPACPKFAITPFLNSSIDPDTNIKAWNY